MKIKSIKLTSGLEIMNNKYPKTYHIGCQTSPVYQIEYEENTPTGITAKGTMELKGENLEKAVEFFDFLEGGLTKEYSKKEIKDEKVDCEGNFNSRNWKSDEEPDMSFDDKPESDKDELLNFTTNLAACLGVDDKFVDEIKKLFK